MSKEDGKTAISRRNSEPAKAWRMSAKKGSSMKRGPSVEEDVDVGGGDKGPGVTVNGERAMGTAVNTLVDGALDAALEAAVATLFAGGVVK